MKIVGATGLGGLWA